VGVLGGVPIINGADYCGCKDTYYVVAQSGQRIWFEDITIKNEDNPVKLNRPRLEVLQALVDKEFKKTI